MFFYKYTIKTLVSFFHVIPRCVENYKDRELTDFELLRIDEAVLPFMNGDSLLDAPTQFSLAKVVEITINGVVYQQPLKHPYTWLEIFKAFDLVLIRSKANRKFDLAGVIQHKSVLSGIWL